MKLLSLLPCPNYDLAFDSSFVAFAMERMSSYQDLEHGQWRRQLLAHDAANPRTLERLLTSLGTNCDWVPML
jgi:hypothetical protein